MDKLSMSLDDMIKAAPPKSGKGKGKGSRAESGGKGGAMKKEGAGKAARAAAAPYGARPKKTLSSMYEESTGGKGAAVVGLTTGTKVQVANLDFNVSKEDIEVRRRSLRIARRAARRRPRHRAPPASCARRRRRSSSVMWRLAS